jgi:hypothetical protein
MEATRVELGEKVATYGQNRGIGGWENRGVWRSRWIWMPLTAFFFAVLGLMITIFVAVDLIILVAAAIGAVVGYFIADWLNRQNQAAVIGADLYTGGVAFIDGLDRHAVRWGDVAQILGRRTEHRLQGVQVRASHQFVIRTTDRGFMLDERVENLTDLVARVSQASGVPIQPLTG